MNKEAWKCQNCNSGFTIEPEDFEFYAKIKVPPPTFCPDCRLQRRLAWRNERTLYKRKCDAPGHNEDIVSIYHPPNFSDEKFKGTSKDSPLARLNSERQNLGGFKVYDQKYWWSDAWDPMDYGRDYNWNKSFFEQFRELMLNTPNFHIKNTNSVNCDYSSASDSKNCYLSVVNNSENCAYVHCIKCRDSFDIYSSSELENCYECIDCDKNFKVFFSSFAIDCIDSYFIFSGRNLQNCFACVNLRNKQYRIFNKLYSKDEYAEKLKDYDFGSFNNLNKILEEFKEFKLRFPHQFSYQYHSVNSTGQNLRASKNCFYCFDTWQNAEDCKYVVWGGLNLKNSYDITNSGVNSFLIYEISSGGLNLSNSLFSFMITNGHSNYYSKHCFDSSNLFGCVGLRHKSYCILNKQYTKEEYEQLVPKIIEHMNSMPYVDKKGRVYKYGEFFPVELSPFSYNETVAQEYFPLTKKEVANKGYSWKDPEEREYQVDIKSEDLPDHIKDVKDDILGKVIQCAHAPIYGSSTPIDCNEQCTTAFKIIPQELEFYRKMNLPLPRLCPNCRHYQRIKQRNPLKLWHRKCQCAGSKSDNGIYKNTIEHSHHKQDHCPNEFETTYASERKEIVYCEQCYLQEVV